MMTRGTSLIAIAIAVLGAGGCQQVDRVIQRPEKIVSMREVIYDRETYAHLASLWQEYHQAYPSEDAYANWMYAARYAGAEDYTALVEAGSKRYSANPTLLYLRSMLHHGKANNLEAQSLLERAVELDPTYMDPWFSLVIHYLERGDAEKTNVALRRILDAGAIADEVMDYSYNMLASVDANAIVVTNGDNDTYPGWILTRVVGYRPDVKLVNQSLLNTDWYPRTVESEGVPHLISSKSLDSLKSALEQHLKEARSSSTAGGPMSDRLIERLVVACRNAGRPVYFAATLQHTDTVKRFLLSGRDLGLATLVTPPTEPDGTQLRRVLSTWLDGFRTGGLDAWALRYARESRAGRMLVLNYALALRSLMDRIVTNAPERRLELFQWYRAHIEALVPGDRRNEIDGMWRGSADIREIGQWCRSRNLSK